MTSGLKVLITIACIVVILAGLKLAAMIVSPLLLAVFIATLASAPISWLVKKGLPGYLAISLVLIGIVLLLATLGAVVVESAQHLYAKQPEYVEKLSALMESWKPMLVFIGLPETLDLRSILDASTLWELASQTLTGVGNAITGGFLILLVFVLIMIESTELSQKVRNLLSRGKGNLDWVDSFSTNINHYIVIKTLHSLLTGVLVWIGLAFIGVDFAILWGLLAFVLNYIPNIGSVIAALPAVLVALVQLGVGPAFAVIGLFLAVNVVVGTFIEPRFMGARLGLSTLVVFISLVFWGFMFGTVGMLLSVPITMTLKLAAEANPETRWFSELLDNKARLDGVASET